AEDVREQLLAVVAQRLGLATRDLALADGVVVAPSRRLTYAEALALRFGMSGGELIGRGVIAPGRTAAPLGGSTPFWEMAVGAAEGSLIPVSPAVANALAQLTGVRLRDLPLTPERVWRALRARPPRA